MRHRRPLYVEWHGAGSERFAPECAVLPYIARAHACIVHCACIVIVHCALRIVRALCIVHCALVHICGKAQFRPSYSGVIAAAVCVACVRRLTPTDDSG